jgi:hypothetical protein
MELWEKIKKYEIVMLQKIEKFTKKHNYTIWQ